MGKLLSIGTWAYAFGPYQSNPVPFDTVVEKLGELKYDGVEIGAFKPHIHPDDYPTDADRQKVKAFIRKKGLRVSGLAADFWGDKGPATDAAQKDGYYVIFSGRILSFARILAPPAFGWIPSMGLMAFRVLTARQPGSAL